MTTFCMNPSHFDKWEHQNQAIYTGEYVEGNLLDNFVMATKRGYAFFREHYLNCWSSDYLVTFVPYKDGYKHNKEYDQAWAEWFAFAD